MEQDQLRQAWTFQGRYISNKIFNLGPSKIFGLNQFNFVKIVIGSTNFTWSINTLLQIISYFLENADHVSIILLFLLFLSCCFSCKRTLRKANYAAYFTYVAFNVCSSNKCKSDKCLQFFTFLQAFILFRSCYTKKTC